MDHEFIRDVNIGGTRLEEDTLKPYFPVTLNFFPQAVQDLRYNKEATDKEFAEIGRQLCKGIWTNRIERGKPSPVLEDK
jgi:hypothetical protein